MEKKANKIMVERETFEKDGKHIFLILSKVKFAVKKCELLLFHQTEADIPF